MGIREYANASYCGLGLSSERVGTCEQPSLRMTLRKGVSSHGNLSSHWTDSQLFTFVKGGNVSGSLTLSLQSRAGAFSPNFLPKRGLRNNQLFIEKNPLVSMVTRDLSFS